MNIIQEQTYVIKYKARLDTSVSYMQIIADSFEEAIEIFNVKSPDSEIKGIEKGVRIVRKSTKTIQVNI